MKKRVILGAILSSLLIGCGSSNNSSSNAQNSNSNRKTQDINESNQSNCKDINVSKYPISSLSQKLKDSIAYMGNEERLAYDVYHNLYNYHIENGIEVRQLKNISEQSEIKHIGIVQDIVRKYNLTSQDLTNVNNPISDSNITFEEMPSGKYDVAVIQELYDFLYAKGTASQRDALEVGCMVEVTDVEDLNRYIEFAKEDNATDIIDAFNFLRDGSYNHYWAFDKGLKNIGVDNGCCSLGTINSVNYCQPDYPNSENDNNTNSQGHGNGNGNGNGSGNRNR